MKQFYRKRLTHVRFEPEVDNGTTYAFEYQTSKLIIGRENMYRLILSVSDLSKDYQTLMDELIKPNKKDGTSFENEQALLIDLLQLVNANVIGIVGE